MKFNSRCFNVLLLLFNVKYAQINNFKLKNSIDYKHRLFIHCFNNIHNNNNNDPMRSYAIVKVVIMSLHGVKYSRVTQVSIQNRSLIMRYYPLINFDENATWELLVTSFFEG